MTKRRVQTSKFLSYVLRHNPEALGLTLGPGGWVDVETLIAAAQQQGHALDRDAIEHVVQNSEKERFTLSDDGAKIRANYGHSIDVDLDLTPAAPPDLLFHGTAQHKCSAIRNEGLRPQSRQYVHLSTDRESARAVGQRHGTPIVLHIRAAAMYAAGHAFYEATGNVWLTDHVPPRFIDDPK